MNHSESCTKNRRRSVRRTPKRATRVSCHKGSLGLGPNVAQCLLDVSETGVRLLSRSAFAAGAEIEVHLMGLGHRRPVKRLSVVVWCVEAADGSYCLGAEFRKPLAYFDLHQLV